MLYFGDLVLIDVYVFRNFKFRKLLLIKIMKLLLCFFEIKINRYRGICLLFWNFVCIIYCGGRIWVCCVELFRREFNGDV